MIVCGRKKISLIAVDLDGTLIQSDSDMGALTRKAIRAVSRQGIYVTICTGRVPPMMLVYAHLININAPYVCANGALICDINGNALNKSPLSREDFHGLGKFCDSFSIPYIAQTAVNMQATRDNPRLAKYEQYRVVCKKYGLALPNIREIDSHNDVDDNEIYKVVISAHDEAVRALLHGFLSLNEELFTYTYSDFDLFDITAPGIDKGTGLKRVAELVGVPLEEVCVFGDYDNDLSSFALAGTKVAMGNASENLRKKADLITLSNDEEGIEHALRELGVF